MDKMREAYSKAMGNGKSNKKAVKKKSKAPSMKKMQSDEEKQQRGY